MQALRVLIVDDSVTIRAMIEEIVSQDPHGSVVGIASDVVTARELIETRVPNLITLDLAMPGIGGLEFLDELARKAHAPVLVISSSTSGDAEATREALAHGADACFDKRMLLTDRKALLALMHRVASRKGAKRALPTGARADHALR